MPLDPTPGSATANTYASVVEADAYNASRLFATDWTTADTPTKEAALEQACRLIDAAFIWTGSATDSVQALAWPRRGMLSRNGFAIDPTAIPQLLKDAQSEFARQLIAADREADNDAEKNNLLGLRAGPVSLTFKDTESSSTVDTKNADVIRKGPKFNYLSKMVPDAVRFILPISWYIQSLVSQPLIFRVTR